MIDIKEIFGKRVRYYRKKKKLSQEQLAELCDLHPTYVGQLERGEKNASLETIMRVCEGLEISPEVLFENVVPKQDVNVAQKIYNIAVSLPEDKQKALLDIVEKIHDML